MKLKVFEEKPKEDIIYFKLLENQDTQSIILIATNNKGLVLTHILSIDNKGIHLCQAVNKNLGLPLDKKGKVIIDYKNDKEEREPDGV